MLLIKSTKKTSILNKTSFNWPIVGFLLFMTGIPGVPAIFLLAIVIIGPSAGTEMTSLINAVYFETPAAILVHASSGVLLFLTMPFQFSPALRKRNSNWHKIGGRIALLSGCVLAVSGVWMHHVLSPDSFGMRYVSLVIMSIAICATFSLALWHIINGNVQVHRKWMIRAVAITLAAVTPLFVEAIIYLLFGQLESTITLLSKIQHDYGRLIGIAINLAIVEFIFIKEKRKRQVHQPLAPLAES